MPSKKESKKQETKNPVGRPTAFKPEYCDMLIDYRAQGGSYQGFGGIVSVSVQTLYDWELTYPEFLDAKRIAKAKHRLYMDNIAKGFMEGKIRGGNMVVWLMIMKNDHGMQNDPLPDPSEIPKVELEFKDE